MSWASLKQRGGTESSEWMLACSEVVKALENGVEKLLANLEKWLAICPGLQKSEKNLNSQ